MYLLRFSFGKLKKTIVISISRIFFQIYIYVENKDVQTHIYNYDPEK